MMSKVIVLLLFLVLVPINSALPKELTYTDKLGRTVTIKIPATRVVSLLTYELIFALKCEDKLVGIGRWAYDNHFINAIKPDVRNIPSPGTGLDINVEHLLFLNPELVITWTMREDVVKFLKERGIKVIAVLPDSIDELYDVIRLHGNIFGKIERAEEIISEMKSLFTLIEKRCSKVLPDQRKKAIWTYSKSTNVNGNSGMIAEIFKIINVKNPADYVQQRQFSTSLEEIIKWNPDHIFLWWGSTEFKIKDLKENQQWKLVNAVKNGRIWKSPEWSTISPAIAVTALWMAMKVYPEQFKDIRFEEIADGFFRKVYGVSYNKSWFVKG